MKKTWMAVVVALFLLAMLSGCGKGTEVKPGKDEVQPGSEYEEQSDVSDNRENDDKKEDTENTDDFEPNADYIQNYSVDRIAYCKYDSDMLWVYASGEGQDENFRAAIDDTGKIYSKIYENYGNLTYLCSSEYLCLYEQDAVSSIGAEVIRAYGEHQIYYYDGTNVTESLLDGSEQIWRVTKTGDDLIIWKYDTIETYSTAKYILRVCDMSGNLLLELDGDEYPDIANALSAAGKVFIEKDQVLKELGSGLYQIGDIYVDVILREVYGPDQYGLGNVVDVYDRCVFSGEEYDDSNSTVGIRFKNLTVYKIGVDEPLYTWASDTDMYLQYEVDNGVFPIYSRIKTPFGALAGEPKKYYDAATGEFLAEYDTVQIGAERIYKFNGENAIAEIKNPAGTKFVTLIDRNGQFLFEPLQTKASESVDDWREELGAVVFYYDGTGYEGEGFYLLSEDGTMKSLHITDADEILFIHNNRMIVINDGEYSLYDLEGNKIR